MSVTYPPGSPTVTADHTQISNLLKDSTQVSMVVNRMAQEKWVSSRLLTGSATVSGGALVFNEDQPDMAADDFEAISPLGEYPTTTFNQGAKRTMSTVKYGRSALISDESIKRQKMDPVNRALRGLVNKGVKEIEAAAMAVIQSSVTATVANSGTLWSSPSADPLYDIALIEAYFEGTDYSPDILLVDSLTYARLMSHPVIAASQTREQRDNAFYTGLLANVMGLTLLKTSQLAAPGVWAFDSTALGGTAVEQLPAEGYAGAPIEVKSIRKDEIDGYKVQARHTSTAYVQAPLAGVRLTGAVA